MYTQKNKQRWCAIRRIRREVLVTTPKSPYLARMPKFFRQTIEEHFYSLTSNSIAGTYNQETRFIHLTEKKRVHFRHEMMHAVNHLCLVLKCSKPFNPFVRFTSWCIARKSRALLAVGLICNETLAYWVEGRHSFFFNPSPHYVSKVVFISKPVGIVWGLIIPLIWLILNIITLIIFKCVL